MKFEKHLKLIIPSEIYLAMKKCSKRARPNEAGGLVFGETEQEEIPEGYQYIFTAQKFECVESSKPSPVSFLMDNLQEFYDIWTEAIIKYKLKLISIFHSHPGTAKPSGFDSSYMKMLLEYDNDMLERGIFNSPNFKYVIWTIMDGKNDVVNGFLILKEKMTQVEVIIQK